MKRKILRLFVVALMLATILITITGCGSNNDKKSEKSETENAVSSRGESIVTALYARLYGDRNGNRTLILSSTDYIDKDRKKQDEDNYVDLGNIYNATTQQWADYCNEITQVIIKDTIEPIYVSSWFYNCRNLANIENINYLNTSNVTNMKFMFFGCYNLKNLDVTNFDTHNVTDMSRMFSGCKSLEKLDLSNFDTHNVTSMSGMISGCYNLKDLDVSNFDTSNVIYMDYMFSACVSLINLDVSNFNTSNVIHMNNMFYMCENLTTIYASDEFITAKVETGRSMFDSCDKLKGGNNTSCKVLYDDVTYARIDKEDEPGYFTKK